MSIVIHQQNSELIKENCIALFVQIQYVKQEIALLKLDEVALGFLVSWVSATGLGLGWRVTCRISVPILIVINTTKPWQTQLFLS